MSFTPFARYRNFTLANLKSLLEVYPDMADSISWIKSINFTGCEHPILYILYATPFELFCVTGT